MPESSIAVLGRHNEKNRYWIKTKTDTGYLINPISCIQYPASLRELWHK
jgi:hypothetical protein